MKNTLDKILTLRGVNYNWRLNEFPEKNFSEGNQIGFIAQELEKIYPELVFTDKDGYKSVDYSRLTPILVEAIKDLSAEVQRTKTELANRNAKLEVNAGGQQQIIENLKSDIEYLKAEINLLKNNPTVELRTPK